MSQVLDRLDRWARNLPETDVIPRVCRNCLVEERCPGSPCREFFYWLNNVFPMGDDSGTGSVEA